MNFRFIFLFLETRFAMHSHIVNDIFIIYTYVVIVAVIYGTTCADIDTYVWYIYYIYIACMYVNVLTCIHNAMHSIRDAPLNARP